MFKNRWFFVLLLAGILLLSACGGGEEAAETTPGLEASSPLDLSAFSIVIADTASDGVKEASRTLNRGIAAYCRIDHLTAYTDWEYKSDRIDTTRRDLEILVGPTNRDESATLESLSLGRLDYVIDHSTTRISILGGSDEALMQAVNYFLTTYLSGSEVILSDLPYVYRHNSEYLKVGDTPFSAFSLLVAQNVGREVEEALVTAVWNRVNVTLPRIQTETESAHYLRLSLTPTLAGQYRIAVSDDSILIEAGSNAGLGQAIEQFIRMITPKEEETVILTSKDSVSETVQHEVLSYTEANAVGKLFVEGTPDKDALSYQVGEEMLFTFRLTDSKQLSSLYACPTFSWSAKADDGQAWSGVVSGEEGMATLRFTLTKPGYLYVSVNAQDDKGANIASVTGFIGGACAGFEQIETVKEEPDDFYTFWQTQLTALNGVAPTLISKVEVKSGNADFYCYDIRVQGHDAAAPVSAVMTYPKNAEPGSLKLKMIYHGYGNYTPLVQYNDGYITVSVNSHSIENGREDAYYQQLQQTTLKNFGFAESDYVDPAKAYFREMILRDVQAFRFAKTLPEWNGEDVLISGGSMGGFQSIAVAALEPGCTHLTIHIVWMCDVGGRTEGRIAGWLPTYSDNLLYFDSTNFAKYVTCKTSITAGLADPTAVPCGITALYNNLSCEKSILMIQSATHDLNAYVVRVEYQRAKGAKTT